MLSVALALLPVVGFLAVLFAMDSFKLVPFRAVLGALVAGGAAALVALFVWSALGLDLQTGNAVSYYVAPVIEETLKSAVVVLLILRGRAGFLVDAAVQGFAVGAGFALLENVAYLQAFGTAPLTLWLVRGRGTAMLHGGTTAIFAILARALSDRFPRRPHVAFLPGLVAVIVIHSAFNHLLLPPIVLAAVVMFVLPLLILFVFD